MNDINEIKTTVRKQAFAARKAVFATGRDAAAQAHMQRVLRDYSDAVLAGYLPIRTEIDPVPVTAVHQGPVGVPVILDAGQPLAFHRWHAGCDLVEGPFGARIPTQGAEVTPRVLIVPLVGFDARGYRLGYGGGFYDRTLAKLRATGPVLALGFAFDAQELPEVPIDAYDQRLDGIVTETGVRLFS